MVGWHCGRTFPQLNLPTGPLKIVPQEREPGTCEITCMPRLEHGTWSEEKHETAFTCGVPGRRVDCTGECDADCKAQRPRYCRHPRACQSSRSWPRPSLGLGQGSRPPLRLVARPSSWLAALGRVLPLDRMA